MKEKFSEPTVRKYREKIEKELKDLCNDFLTLIDKIPANDTLDEVYNLKMKGDFNRYLAEVTTENERETFVHKSQDEYQEAFTVSKTKLEPTYPLRLTVVIDYAKFCHEILGDLTKACQLSQEAVKEASPELEKLEGIARAVASRKLETLGENILMYCKEDTVEGDTPEEDSLKEDNLE